MKIDYEQRGNYLLVFVKGRLDASWADYFTDELLRFIRNGQHHLIVDASEMIFLSSAGIRSLLLVHKELKTVSGSFAIVSPTAFVEQTLRTSGFQLWLEKGLPKDMPAAPARHAHAQGDAGEHTGIQRFILNEGAMLTVFEPVTWHPWQMVEKHLVKTLAFSPDTYALGIGSAAAAFDDARDQFGEFLGVSGNVVYQPPDEHAPPDYLIAEKQFVPRMQCIQALICKGDMGNLIRFAPTDKIPFYSMSALLRNILDQTQQQAAGFVMLGEVEGLVGATLIRSPGLIGENRKMIPFPEIREWLAFCGERAYPHQQALLAGVVSPNNGTRLPPMPSAPDMAAHVHGAVFPYQPLQNGKIGIETAVGKFFNGPPPIAVMHIADDIRPVVGLGESALIRGACWFGPLQNPEVLS